MTSKVKVLLSKLGLDVHNRGLITVAKELMDAGMEIIYIGNSLPKEILSTAIQEGVDVDRSQLPWRRPSHAGEGVD